MISSDPKQVQRICFDNLEVENMHQLDVAKQHGAYAFLPTVLKDFDTDRIIDEVKVSGLRGRGGAGFPTGLKWSFVP
ncbi:MAG: NADH-quinone oxidoreductase subunit F, partial [Ghiorsea sp.]